METSFKPNFPYAKSDEPRLMSTPERIQADPAYTGRGVTIAFLDSGFFPHPDLGQRIKLHVDATTRKITTSPDDCKVDVMSWHGQMTSVIAAGDGHLSGGQFRGIATESELVLIRISNKRHQIKEADIQRGFNWLLAHHAEYNVRIVNVSVGGDAPSKDPDHPLHQQVRQLTEAGLIVVLASGNKGQKMLVPPASSAHGITVGGYEDHNTLDPSRWTAYSSNYGHAYDDSSKPDLIAPARWIASPILPETTVAEEAEWLGALLTDHAPETLEQIIATAPEILNIPPATLKAKGRKLHHLLEEKIHTQKLISPYYQHVDGTSVAAPIVSAVIAQMLQVNPALTPTAVRDILRETAIHVPRIAAERQGGGAVHGSRAVAAAKNS